VIVGAIAVAVLMHSTTYDDEESLAIVSQWMIGHLDPTG
jgi:hypothetical protein